MSGRMKTLLSQMQQPEINNSMISIKPNPSVPLHSDSLEANLKLSQANLSNTQSSLSEAGSRAYNRDNTYNPVGDAKLYRDQLSDVESFGGDYNALNAKSGAHGRYQIMPNTYKEWEGKLGITHKFAQTPAGQDKIFDAITNRNRISLMRNNIEPTRLNLYGAHQLGAAGYSRMHNDNVVNMKHLKSNMVSSREEWYSKYGPRFK